MNRTTTYFIAGSFTGAALAIAAAVAVIEERPKSPYAPILLAPADGYETIGTLSASLVQAIEAAEHEVGGRAHSASFDLDAVPSTVTVTLFSETSIHRVVVDAEACAIKSAEVVPRFPGEEVEGEWTLTASGLRYFDLVEGDGDMPEGRSTFVTVHYTGWLNDGTKFDSSHDRGQPTPFQLGRVIPGWTEGVASMRVGGKRKLVIPPHLGYGDRNPPGIPPGATLIFDVELLEVREGAALPPQPPQRPGH